MGFAPQILHCNDWHTAIGPLWLRTDLQLGRAVRAHAQRAHDPQHRLPGRRSAPRPATEVLGGARLELLHQDDLRAGRINLLRHGLLYADLLTTVSPTYAREIQTAEYGMGLDDTLRARSGALIGILNGVDYDGLGSAQRRAPAAALTAPASWASRPRSRQEFLAARGLQRRASAGR